MRTFTTRLLSLVLVSGLTSPLFAQVDLRMKFTPGQEIRSKLTQSMISEANFEGRDLKTTVDQTMMMNLKVDSVAEDGSAKTRQTISRVQMAMQTPPPLSQKIEFDTDTPDADQSVPPGMDLMKALVGKEMKSTMTPTGKHTDIVIPDELTESLKSSAGGPAGAGLSEDGIKKILEQSASPLPGKVVNPGDKWKENSRLELPFGAMAIEQDFTYTGPNSDGLHAIDFTMTIQLEPNDSQPVKMTLTDSEGKGQILYDAQLGHPVSVTTDQDFTISIDLGGQTIVQKMHQKMRLEVER